jgi:hypothetical protein
MPVLESTSPSKSLGKRSSNASLSKLSTPNKSKKGTPIKKSSSKSPSKLVQSPKKSLAKESAQSLANVADLPDAILQALLGLHFETFDDLKNVPNVDELFEQCIPLVFKDKNADGMSVLLQRELLKAWLRFLIAKAQGSEGTKKHWRDWMDSRLRFEEGTIENAQGALKKIRPSQLIKQRQTLKHVQPRPSKVIDHTQLKQAMKKLVAIPTGKAMSRRISENDLQHVKKSLKKK